MPALVVLFNLKTEADRAAYEEWARTTDVPTVKGLKSIDDFRVYRMNAVMGSDGKPPYQYCEVIDINDMDGLGPELETATMQRVAGEFQAFADGPIFVVSDQIA